MKFIYRLKQMMLATGDLVGFCLAFWLSLVARNQTVPDWEKINTHLTLFFVLFLFWLVINYINNLYDLQKLKYRETNRYFFESALFSLLFSFILVYILPNRSISPKTILILNIFLGYCLSYLWRWIFNKYINTRAMMTKVIFVGLTKEMEELSLIMIRHPELGFKISAVVDPTGLLKNHDYPFFEIYHGLPSLQPAIKAQRAELIIISPLLQQEANATRQLYELLFWDVKLQDASSFYELLTGRIPPSTFSQAWFLNHLQKQRPVYKKINSFINYLFGLLMAVIFIILFLPIAVAIKISSPGPIFFKQKRVGLYGKEFWLYKLRSMYAVSADGSAETAGAQFATKGDKRITRIGKILRQTRFDELPQFINLLKGDIAFIGPRPERPEIVKQLQDRMPYYHLRHIIKPGLTGWAAVHQHYTDNLETSLEKLQYDLFYIKNQSLLLDLSIILKTINVVLRMMGQ